VRFGIDLARRGANIRGPDASGSAAKDARTIAAGTRGDMRVSPLSRLRRQASLVLRLRPFDTSTVEGRSQERYRRIALAAIGAFGARSIGLITSLVSIPLALRYLGTERYGLWVTITSFTWLLGFLDLGVGNGLINAVADANGRDDEEQARRYVSSTLVLLLAVAAASGAIFAVIYPHISWGDVFNVTSSVARSSAGPTTVVLVSIVLISLPLSVVTSVQLGYQEGFRNNLWIAAANALSLVAVLTALTLRADLPWLVLASTGVLPTTMLVNGLVIFLRQHPRVAPRFAAVTRAATRHMSRLGTMYLVAGLGAALGFQSDTIVIARILGADRVPEYAVPMRLFLVGPTLVSLALNPLWPAYGESIARGDTDWARHTLRRSLGLSAFVNLPIAAALVFLGPWVIDVWVGPDIATPPLMMVALGLFAALTVIGGPFAMFLHGAQAVRFLAVVALLSGVCNIGISIILVREIGPAGAVYGTLTAQVLVVVLPATFYIRRLLDAWAQQSLQKPERVVPIAFSPDMTET
jgi:O-antigen/teichoic acid export membrane protein